MNLNWKKIGTWLGILAGAIALIYFLLYWATGYAPPLLGPAILGAVIAGLAFYFVEGDVRVFLDSSKPKARPAPKGKKKPTKKKLGWKTKYYLWKEKFYALGETVASASPQTLKWILFAIPLIGTIIVGLNFDWNWWQWLSALVMTPINTFILFWGLSYRHIFWGQVPDNHGMIIQNGSRFARQVINATMYEQGRGSGLDFWEVHPVDDPEILAPAKDFFERFGMFWIGIPPWVTAKRVTFITKTIIDKKPDKSGILEFTFQENEESYLAFPLLILHAWQSNNIDTLAEKKSKQTGKLPVNLTSQGQFLLNHPYRYVYNTAPDKAMDKINGALTGTDKEMVSVMTYDQLARARSEHKFLNGKLVKNEDPDVKKDTYGEKYLEIVNKSIAANGLLLMDVDLEDHQPANKETADAIQRGEIARMNADARIQEGRGEGGFAREKGLGEADAIRARGAAKAREQAQIMHACNDNPEVAAAYLNKDAWANAGGEGPNGTRPDVVMMGAMGAHATVDVSRYAGRDKRPGNLNPSDDSRGEYLASEKGKERSKDAKKGGGKRK